MSGRFAAVRFFCVLGLFRFSGGFPLPLRVEQFSGDLRTAGWCVLFGDPPQWWYCSPFGFQSFFLKATGLVEWHRLSGVPLTYASAACLFQRPPTVRLPLIGGVDVGFGIRTLASCRG